MANQTTVAERVGRAMGSTMHVVATGDPEQVEDVLSWAVTRVAELEQRWSRFNPTSEVSMMNSRPGRPTVVSDDTMRLIDAALEARRLSGGRFDPTMLQALCSNGYDRTFVAIRTSVGTPALNTQRIGLGRIDLDHETNTVTLSDGTGFDPGGIGKGLAADLIAEGMIQRGAAGALVNLGGDVRCAGHGPSDGGWAIDVGDDIAGVPWQRVHLSGGAVATSTSRRRTWRRRTTTGETCAHHLLDPATGQSSARAADLVTVIAARCADAEWLATAIAAEGSLPTDRTMLGDATVLVTDHRGRRHVAGSPEEFLR